MKKGSLFLLAIVGLACLVWVWSSRSPELAAPNDMPEAEEPTATRLTAAGDRRAVPGASPEPQARRERPKLAREFLIDRNDELYIGATEEYIQWLNDHGFTSSEAYTEAWAWVSLKGPLDAAYFEDLRDFSGLEIAKAKAFAFTYPEDSAAALDYLQSAAVAGSINALYALADIHAHPSHGPDPIAAVAFSEVAQLRGDWMAVVIQQMLVHLPMNMQLIESELMLARIQAFNILSELNQLRALQGLPPLESSIRPGLPAWEEMLEYWQEGMEAAAEEDPP